jgi:hypothetical protein
MQRLPRLPLVLVGWLVTGGAAALTSADSFVQKQQPIEAPARYSAVAISSGGPRTTSGATRVDIQIDRWSTDAERQRLLEALKQGQDALLAALRDLKPVGRINTPGNLGYDLHYANQVAGDEGGHRLFIATDRPISFWEATSRPRSINYPFTFIEMRMTRDGVGEGRLTLATRVSASLDGRYIELENYAAQPVQLNEIRRVDRTE